jgi:hypothetical protein
MLFRSWVKPPPGLGNIAAKQAKTSCPGVADYTSFRGKTQARPGKRELDKTVFHITASGAEVEQRVRFI